MSSRTNPTFDLAWARVTHFYKVEAIACLRTSMKSFNALGIVPGEVEENSHCESKKAYVYTVQQVREAARRLKRWSIFLGLGGDPSLIPEAERAALGIQQSSKAGLAA